MFNPEKLLGGMLRSGMRGGGRSRGGGLGSLVSGGAALGLVGVAMEAVEHYMNKSSTPQPSAAPTEPPPAPGTPSMPATGGAPPPPPQASAPPTPPPGAAADQSQDRQSEAVLLIRAMIAAANADGLIDTDERANILGKLQKVDLSTEEHAFIVHELLAPKPIEDLLVQVKTADMAKQVYAASLLSIYVDTDVERQYLISLARQLNLDEQAIQTIHDQLGVAVP